jgi:hypothetical protein
MSVAILSFCLLAKPLSPADARPEPGTFAFARYAIRAAASVRKGMTVEQAEAVLGVPAAIVENVLFRRDFYTGLGLAVDFGAQDVVVGGERREELHLRKVRFFSARAFLPAR